MHIDEGVEHDRITASRFTEHHGLETGRYAERSDLRNGHVSQLIVVDLNAGTERLVLETNHLTESPNWTPDGAWFVVNGHGKLYRLPGLEPLSLMSQHVDLLRDRGVQVGESRTVST